ncbi:MAG: class I SAM-dependent methyltransferase [Elusimicrobia bacterium]|nr:class I SAM-dependent methyltransferase [Elusimicrobiota bacterium]
MDMKKSALETYSDPEVVAYYGGYTTLEPCERALFGKYVRPGLRVLDVGVGAGRTTPALSSNAKRYVGIDHSEGMVRECARRFPGLSFLTMDASSLAAFEDASFDVCVFSFNGIDYLHPDEKRESFLRECARVLAPDGTFIFSVHNSGALLEWPKLSGAPLVKKAWRILLSGYLSARRLVRMLPSRAYREGHGYIVDPIHGGILTWHATPEIVEAELQRAGFVPRERLTSRDPEWVPRIAIQWYYYAASKAARRDA